MNSNFRLDVMETVHPNGFEPKAFLSGSERSDHCLRDFIKCVLTFEIKSNIFFPILAVFVLKINFSFSGREWLLQVERAPLLLNGSPAA